MSVQLIVYPQSYDGSYNAISSSPSEALVNGISFTNLDSSNSYDSPNTVNIILDVLTNAPPVIVNSWYRYRSISLGTPNLPVVLAADLVLNSTTTQSISGVYQKLSNLTIGSQYTFTIDVSTPASDGFIVLSAFNGTNLIAQPIFWATLSQITYTFTAASTSDTIIISYSNNASNSVTISNASIQPVIGAVASGVTQMLGDGQVICDLYEDEDIPLSLSVDDFKNVAEKVQSYSKAFKLPATKKNNRIFDYMFEITRSDNGIMFNPYNRTECVLKQDGFILFKGYLKMLDINDKNGEISYNVNLYSEVVALADILKDRTFDVLDFSELEHEYNYSEIRNSWQGILGLTTALQPGTYAGTPGASTTSVLRYPFVDWSHQYRVSGGNPVLPNLESSFRPFIQLKYLINIIFEATPFTWESSVFDSTDFEKLFMDFNWGSDEQGAATLVEGTLVQQDSGSPTFEIDSISYNEFAFLRFNTQISVTGGIDAYWDNTDYRFASTVNNLEVTVVYDINLYSVATNYSYSNNVRIAKFNAVHQVIEVFDYNNDSVPKGTFKFMDGTFSTILQTGEYIMAQSFSSVAGIDKIIMSTSAPSSLEITVSNNALSPAVLLTALRGELGQWDFLKGIMTMFNLVSLPDEDNPNNIKFENYGDIFHTDTSSGSTWDLSLALRSIQHDWTDRIDVAEMKLTPLTDLNKTTIFKFVEDDDDFCFTEYKRQVGGHLYGSKKWEASLASNGLATVLEGEEEIVAEPFAATICDTLMPQYWDFVVPKIYASSDDETEGFDNSPRIMYNNGVKTLTSCTYNVPSQNCPDPPGCGDAFEDEFLQFSHLTNIPTVVGTRDFHFGQCQLLNGVGASVPDNLFYLYWLPYYNELYNPDTRTMTIKVNLSPSIINTFKFSDTVMIKNREFRVNKIDYKPNDLATVEFILIP